MGVAFCQEPDGPGVPSCLPPASLLGASYVQDRTGAPRPAAQKQKPARRVSVDGREACVPCEQAEVLSGYPDSTGAEGGGGLAGGSALDPTHTSWISEGRASQSAHAPRTGAVFLRRKQPLPPPLCGTASPVRLELLL